jgi:single-stranded-DNA-specific exonuclease
MRPAPKWVLPAPVIPETQELARALSLSLPVAAVLWQRGYREIGAARRFLQPCLSTLQKPESLRDMTVAAQRVLRAIEHGERILIYGDYDVDGVTSVSILTVALRMLGANPDFHVPHRLRDGYGIHASVIEREAQRGTRLIISVDTGIRAVEEVELATRLGIDMVVTDHHIPGDMLPPALAVLNPNRRDEEYPEKTLCGAGVTLKLVHALFAQAGWPSEKQERVLLSLMKLAAIGTIADVVPLTGENRVVVWHGLRGLQETKSPGLAALLTSAGIQPGEIPTAGQIAFRVAPRINAAGRMADAVDAVEMLLTQDAERATAIAEALSHHNAERQASEQRILSEIQRVCDASLPDEKRLTLVCHGLGWHRGIVGIVASRVVERYGRPAFVLGVDPETGIAQGSGRSITGLSLLDALESMADLFEKFGGHHMAAGVTLRAERVAEFSERLNEYASEHLEFADLASTVRIDAVLEPEDLSQQTADQVEQLGPFGMGNPTPLFLLKQVEIAESPRVFAEKHLGVRICYGGRFHRVRGWNWAQRANEFVPGRTMDMAVTMECDPRSAEKGYAGWAMTLREIR